MELSRRTLLQWGAGGVAVAAVGLSPVESAVAQVRRRRFAGDPGPGRLYYGASSEQDVNDWERQMGQRLALHRTFFTSAQVQKLIRTARTDLANGRLPHVSMKVPGRWIDVARGRRDGWLRGIARGLAHLDRPVFLTFHHEPENDTRRKGSPRDFVAMQRHVIRYFSGRAPKVTIVPVLQSWTFSDYNRRARPEQWSVPEAAVYGVDVYNPFCVGDRNWVPFSEKLDEIRRYAHGKPIAIGEYGCRDDPDNPERAAQWMRDAFHYARRHNVVSMSYFNSGRNSPEGSWLLEGSRAVVFENRLASSAVVRPG